MHIRVARILRRQDNVKKVAGQLYLCHLSYHDRINDIINLIVIWAPGGSQLPYSSPKSMAKNSECIYWIRKMASTISPSEEEKRDLYNLANNVPFDDRMNHEATIEDINALLVKSYLKEVGSMLYSEFDNLSFETVCRSLGIIDGPAEYTKPKNVGLMFFNMQPEKFFPYSQIDIVELPEGESGNIIRERSFKGPLNQQLQDAIRYLNNSVIEEHVIKLPNQAESVRYLNYPYAALEEALANAVYHKGYDSREPIEVRVLPDRIEILSHPGADRSITLEGLSNFRAVCRRYRNRRIGEFLKELRLTEGRNTGIHKILRSLRENGSPEPVFETDENRLYFLVTIFAHKTQNGEGKKGTQAPRKQKQTVHERQDELLSYFSANPKATVAEAAEKLGASTATLNRDIRELEEKKCLSRNGSNKSGSWIVSKSS